MNNVKIAAISYINSTPFVYGLNHTDFNLSVDILLNTPSDCVTSIENGNCDIAIVPLASLLWLKNVKMVSDFGISSNGNVRTVELLSNSPISEITDIYLDSESRTSALLVRILADEFWNISPNWHQISYKKDEIIMKEGVGYLMIGDKVFDWENKFTYNYDLAKAWKEHTSLPFVFAVWVAREDIDDDSISELNRALKCGVEHIDETVDTLVSSIDKSAAKKYLTENIEFCLNDEKREAIDLFLSKAHLLRSKESPSPM